MGKYLHFFNWFAGKDERTQRRNAAARLTWDAQVARGNWQLLDAQDPFWHNPPTVTDVFDFAAARCPDDTVMVFTNCDTCLASDLPEWLDKLMILRGICCAAIANFEPEQMPKTPPKAEEMQINYPGTDMYACRPETWRKMRERMPLMYLGYGGWDFVLRKLFQEVHPDAMTSLALVYHENHPKKWGNLAAPEVQFNVKAGLGWAAEYGYAHTLLPRVTAGLFRCEGYPKRPF